MALKNLPIHLGMVVGVAEVGLRTQSQAMVDCFVDEINGVNRRFGYVEFCDLGTSSAVDGLIWWPANSMVIAVSNGDAFKITANDGTFSALTMTNSFAAGTRVKFADHGTTLYAANGDNIKSISTTEVANLADVDAPTSCTHVNVLDTYLIGNEDGTGNFHWSDVGAPTDWGGNYAEEEGRPDDILAMDVANLQLYLLGAKTLGVWHNDGSTPFVRLLQGFVEVGTCARYSFIWCPEIQSFMWLDENRRPVVLNGVSPLSVSSSLSRYLSSFSTVNDCIGDYAVIGGRPYGIFNFPTENETIVWDFVSKQWYQWGYYNTGTASYDRFRGNCFCYATDWNLQLMGDKSNGKIYKFDSTTFDDDGDDLRTMIRTGHIDWGTTDWKQSRKLIFRVKKTAVSPGADAVYMTMRYRDNGETTWSSAKTITLTAQSGQTDYFAEARRLGRYRTRQWEFVCSNAIALSVAQIQEDVA